MSVRVDGGSTGSWLSPQSVSPNRLAVSTALCMDSARPVRGPSRALAPTEPVPLVLLVRDRLKARDICEEGSEAR